MDAYFFENEQKNLMIQVVEGLVNLVPRVLSYPPTVLSRSVRRVGENPGNEVGG